MLKQIIAILLIPLVTTPSCLQSGNPVMLNKDSLINYSYIINGKDNSTWLTSGTGSILRYHDKYYLITNYHVLTGKDYKDQKKFPELRDTNTSISIIFQPLDRASNFVVMVYPLFNSQGHENFETLKFQDQILDLAIMPIVVPDNAATFSFDSNDIDTTGSYAQNEKMTIMGFPNGQFKSSWQPTPLEVLLIKNPQSGPNINDPFVFFDRPPVKGVSGSPGYILDRDGRPKVLAIVSNIVDPRPETGKIRGRSIYASNALQLIKEAYQKNKPPVVAEVYKQ